MKKKTSVVRSPRKGKKNGENITTTSVAFKTPNLDGLKSHPLHDKTKGDRSVSWIINRLVEDLLAGKINID